MEEIEKISIFAKKQEDLTVGDNIKIASVVLVVGTVLPIAVMGAVIGVVSLWEKRQMRKLAKSENPTNE